MPPSRRHPVTHLERLPQRFSPPDGGTTVGGTFAQEHLRECTRKHSRSHARWTTSTRIAQCVPSAFRAHTRRVSRNTPPSHPRTAIVVRHAQQNAKRCVYNIIKVSIITIIHFRRRRRRRHSHSFLPRCHHLVEKKAYSICVTCAFHRSFAVRTQYRKT